LLNITCGDLLPSPLPLSPTGRGVGVRGIFGDIFCNV